MPGVLGRAGAHRDGGGVNLRVLLNVRMALLDMSKSELAEKSGASYPHLCQVLKGQKDPSYRTMSRLAEALGFASAEDMLMWGTKVKSLLEDA